MIRETAWNAASIICKLARVQTNGYWILMGYKEDYQKNREGVDKTCFLFFSPFRVNSASFHGKKKKKQEKQKLEYPSLSPFLTIIFLVPTSVLVIMDLIMVFLL